MTHTIEPVQTHQTPSSSHDASRPPRRSRGALVGWVVVIVGLVAAVILALLAITSDSAPQRTENQAPAKQSVGGVPMSADAAERYLAGQTAARPGVPMSADAAERDLAPDTATRPMGTPGSADAAERYLAELK